MSRLRAFLQCALLAPLLLLIAGCGGGGGPSPPPTSSTNLRLTIRWAERARDLQTPGSALSCRIALYQDADLTASPVHQWVINRHADPAAYSQQWVSPQTVQVRSWLVVVRFYAQAAGQGAIVAEASQAVTLASDGSGANNIVVRNRVAAAGIISGQHLAVGERRAILFTARDADGAVVAVSPGSEWWTIISGASVLAIEDGVGHGLRSGTASVTVTVDGMTGSARTITVDQIIVAVTPTNPIIQVNGAQQFTARVTGAVNTAVTWRVVETGGGAITAQGLYTAPTTAGAYHVRATSVADGSASGTATVTVTGLPPITVTVSPSSAAVIIGGTQIFTATVTGTTNTAVTWRVVETGGGTVTAQGLYTAPAVAGTYHVRATSVADGSASGTATVTVTTSPPPITVTVSPSSAIVVIGHRQRFTATVTGTTNTAVLWRVDETGGGSIDGTGYYTAPATEGTYHVRAISDADPTRSGTATVTVRLPTITISPSLVTVIRGRTQRFTATVSYLPSTEVTWSLDRPEGGTIDANGLYTAPIVIGSRTSFYVTATCVADPTASATAQVNVTSFEQTVWRSGDTTIRDVAVDADGNVYLAAGQHIYKYTFDGRLLDTWNLQTQANVIEVGPDGSVYTALYGGAEVCKYAPDGALVIRWGSRGDGPGQFNFIGGLAADSEGRVFVGDRRSGPSRVQVFSSNGAYLYHWSLLPKPTSLAVYGSTVFLNDGGNVYSYNDHGGGQYIYELVGSPPLPSCVAVDGQGALYVKQNLGYDVDEKRRGYYRYTPPTREGWMDPNDDGYVPPPSGIAVDAIGNHVYLVNTTRGGVHHFNYDAW